MIIDLNVFRSCIKYRIGLEIKNISLKLSYQRIGLEISGTCSSEVAKARGGARNFSRV
jgi:hypothetical protein